MVLVSSRMHSCVTGSLPFAPAAYCTPLSPCTAASMARRLAAIKDRARGPTHSVPLFFSCKQQEKNRRPRTTGTCSLPVSSRMTTGNRRNRRRVGGRALPAITGRNRTKTGSRRNPSLQDKGPVLILRDARAPRPDLRHLYRTRAPGDEDG